MERGSCGAHLFLKKLNKQEFWRFIEVTTELGFFVKNPLEFLRFQFLWNKYLGLKKIYYTIGKEWNTQFSQSKLLQILMPSKDLHCSEKMASTR